MSYKIADEYGSYLPYETTVYDMACRVAYCIRNRGLKVMVVDTETGRATSEVFHENADLDTFASGLTDKLLAGDYESRLLPR